MKIWSMDVMLGWRYDRRTRYKAYVVIDGLAIKVGEFMFYKDAWQELKE